MFIVHPEVSKAASTTRQLDLAFEKRFYLMKFAAGPLTVLARPLPPRPFTTREVQGGT